MSDFHVDYINGSNATGSGTAANPWATVTFAMAEGATGAGDTIKVAGSALTTVDSTATLSTEDTLTTTTDLTTSISVNDIVVVMPNGVTQFEDWVTVQVVAITSTTIQFYEDIYMPGDWNAPSGGTAKYTIKTIDSIVESTDGTFETFANGLGENTLVEGGYDATFTSIVGITYFRRGGLGGGSSTGTGWNFQYPNNDIDIPIIKNFWFGQWASAINTSFGGTLSGTNLRVYMGSSRAFGYFSNVWDRTGATTDLYFINSSGSFGTRSYSGNALAAGWSKNANCYNFVGNRNNTFTDQIWKKQVTWNPGINNNGAVFGRTNNQNQANILYADCEYVTNIIEPNRGTFGGTKQLVQFFPNATGRIDSLTLIDGNAAQYFYAVLDNTESAASSPSKKTITMPTGWSLESPTTMMHVPAGRGGVNGYVNAKALIDSNGTWIAGQGTYQKVSTTEFDTGNSSRQVIVGSRVPYGSADAQILLTQVTKTSAAQPTTITLRIKGVSMAGGPTSYNSRVYYGTNVLGGDLTASNATIPFNDTWTDVTYTVATDTLATAEWNAIPTGGTWQAQLNILGGDAGMIYIDSITINY